MGGGFPFPNDLAVFAAALSHMLTVPEPHVPKLSRLLTIVHSSVRPRQRQGLLRVRVFKLMDAVSIYHQMSRCMRRTGLLFARED